MSNPAVAQYHFHADWGLTLSRPFIWRDTDGDPVTVTGYGARLQVRQAYSTVPVLDISDSDYISVGTTDGRFDIAVPAALMEIGSPYTDSDYVWDLVIDTGGGSDFKLVEGAFTIHPTSTREP